MKNYITIDPKEIEEAALKYSEYTVTQVYQYQTIEGQRKDCKDDFTKGFKFALSKSNETISPILERALEALEQSLKNDKVRASINEIKALQK